MRVLFLMSQPLRKNTGGVERVTYVLAQQFASASVDIGFGFCRNDHLTGSDPDICAVRLFANADSDFFVAEQQKMLEHFAPDVIINQGGRWPGNLNSLRYKDNVKIITVYHGMIWSPKVIADTLLQDKGELLPRWKKTAMFLLRYRYYFKQLRHIKNLITQSDFFVTCSNNLVQTFQKLADAGEKHKILAINNPASYEAIDIADKQKEILCVSRLEYSSKRLDYVLKAWKYLEKKFPDWKLTIVGGPVDDNDVSQIREMKRLKKIALQYSLKRVHFEGFKDPLLYYKRSSIFAMTSKHEAWGMTLVEAQSLGVVPVVFNSFPAASEIISDGVNGILVPAFNTKKYAAALEKLMADDSFRRILAENAVDSSRRFEASVITDKWIKLFEQF